MSGSEKKIGRRSMDIYQEITDAYASELRHALGSRFSLFAKWTPDDYVYPFSDVDLRIAMPEAEDLNEISDILCRVHRKMVASVPFGDRILEHPYGFLYLDRDIAENRVIADDIKRCYFVNGEVSAFRKLAVAAEAYAMSDPYFLRIIDGRLGRFTMINEYRFRDPVYQKQYETYCLLWHYYLPCAYAVECLKAGRVYPQKICLDWYRSEYLSQIILEYREGRIGVYDNDLVLKETERDLRRMLTKLPDRHASRRQEEDRALVTEAVCMLRTRCCRIAYYLAPPLGIDTKYLMRRELSEFERIACYLDTCGEAAKELRQILRSDGSEAQKLRYIKRSMEERAEEYKQLCRV